MSAKPTLGPWEARGRGGMSDGGSSMLHAHFRGDIVAGPAKRTIISSSSLLGIQGDTPEQAEANAHLIAAVPDLFAKLREADGLINQLASVIIKAKLIDHMPSGLQQKCRQWLRDGATTVLIKAEGRNA